MNTRCYLRSRISLLDVAKEAVETFIKVRQRSPESRGDRYMLLSFEDPPHNVKAGWKENIDTFMHELKNLSSNELTTTGNALKNAFDLLNINRMQFGFDTYGQGRCPFYLDPSIIILITDGGKVTGLSGIQDILNVQYIHDIYYQYILPTILRDKKVNIPLNSSKPGSEMTKEAFRWDQRLYSLVLRLPGTPAIEQHVGLVPSDMSPIDQTCEETGGRSYCVTSHRILMQCIDSLVQKVQSGVVIHFEKFGPDPLPPEVKSDPTTQAEKCKGPLDSQTIPNSLQDTNSQYQDLIVVSPFGWQMCRKQIYVARSTQKGVATGYWPIPESYWPESKSLLLPQRTAHPKVMFTCTNHEPLMLDILPFDKYELEPSPLTQFILARKQPNACWQVFVKNSYKNNSELGYPFGFLKASTNLTCVNLFVMPYNYPVLLPLLDELFKCIRLDKKTTPFVHLRTSLSQLPNMINQPPYEWGTQFQSYLRTMPPYYNEPLKYALIQMGIQESLVQVMMPNAKENNLSLDVVNYLKELKQQAKLEFELICSKVHSKTPMIRTCQNKVPIVSLLPLKKEVVSHPLLKETFKMYHEQIHEFGKFVVRSPQSSRTQYVYHTSSNVSRDQLVDQCHVLRKKVWNLTSRPEVDANDQHNLPISRMGNYQEYLKYVPMPLREIESTPVRHNTFGNPFKVNKMMVDETDMDPAAGTSPIRGIKRPLPRDLSPQHQSKKY